MPSIRRNKDIVSSAETQAIEAVSKHEAGLALIAQANEDVREAKHTLSAHAYDKAEQAEALLLEADELKAAAHLLAIGQNSDEVREVFAVVK